LEEKLSSISRSLCDWNCPILLTDKFFEKSLENQILLKLIYKTWLISLLSNPDSLALSLRKF
jgi:hypothetical protein